MNATEDLARRVDAIALATPGVVRLYSSVPLALRVAGRAAPGADADAPRSTVSLEAGAVVIRVDIGVDAASPAGETADRVAAALRTELAGLATGADAGELNVRVRVSRVTLS